jgi:lysozyme
MKVSDNGLAIIKHFEGFGERTYRCPAGKATIGYGHVLLPADEFWDGTTGQALIQLFAQSPQSAAAALKICEHEAHGFLRKDAAIAEAAVKQAVLVPLTQGQFDALVSFTFNVGTTNFRTSTLLKRINAGRHADAAAEFARWVYSNGQKLAGLEKRRAAEAGLYKGQNIQALLVA